MMSWEKLLKSTRYGPKSTDGPMKGRSPYNRDVDRIIFSSPFRRLGKKTQVHPLAQNDHIHTRLTHSLEVASVGRTLGLYVGEELDRKGLLPEGKTKYNLAEIVAAACLAHDIGNPPFGHAGEDAIRSWFKSSDGLYLLDGLEENEKTDFLLFEGNALSFRYVTKTEYYQNDGGMRLTYPTLGAMLKYPWTSMRANLVGKSKFSCFRSEIEMLNLVGVSLGMVMRDDNHWCRHPLSYLVEAADDICYSILDIEDGHELGILDFNSDVKETLKPLYEQSPDFDDSKKGTPRNMVGYIRGLSIGVAIRAVGANFIENIDAIMDGTLSAKDLIECCDSIRDPIRAAKKLADDRIFNDRRKVELETGSYSALGILLDAFINAAHELILKSRTSFKSDRILKLMGEGAPKKKIIYMMPISVLLNTLGE